MNTSQTLSQHYGQILNLKKPWGIEKVNLDTDQKRLTISVSTKKGAKLPCPTCASPCPKEDHRQERIWRHLDTMQFETLISCRIPRIHCREHGILSVNVPWAGEYSHFTLLFEKFAIDVLKASKSVSSAMSLLKLSWDQIHEVRKRAVERGTAKRKEEEIHPIGIDEKSFLKGHSSVSLMTDIAQSRVLDVVPERTQEATEKLLNTLSDSQKQSVTAAAVDMWKAYRNAVGVCLPNAEVVHDKYHVATYLGKSVDTVRKQEHTACMKSGNEMLKGTKYLWLTNPQNWNKDTKKAFRELAKSETKVGRAWSIKEAFRHFWEYRSIGVAKKFFRKWYFWATHSKLKPVVRAAKTLKRHFDGILAYLRHHITNAATEGLNSQIQNIKSNARGFKNFANYRIAILFSCGKLDLYP